MLYEVITPLIDSRYRIDEELLFLDCLEDFVGKNQVANILFGNDDPLFACQSSRQASMEESFDFLSYNVV